MRAGDPGFVVTKNGDGGTWNLKREPDQAWPGIGDATDFSRFRLAVPECAGFEGVHIYMDADMLVLGDVAELLELPRKAPWLCLSSKRTDVSVIDASAFKDVRQSAGGWWPSLAKIAPGPHYLIQYRELLKNHGFFDASLPEAWNWCDDKPRPIAGAKLLHFTTVPTQPWKPYASVRYSPHPCPEWVALWNQYDEESRAACV